MSTQPKLRLSSKVLWPLVLLLIAGSWIGNVQYFESVQLKKALFFEHVITINGFKHDLVELSYLENRGEKRKITGIQLEELPSLRFQVRNHSDYRHQIERTMIAEWHPSAGVEQVPIIVREATVFYDEGSSERLPIGELRVIWEEEEPIFETSSGGSSSDGTGFSNVTLTRAATLVSVDYSFSDRLDSGFDLQILQADEAVELPLKLDKFAALKVKYGWSIPDEIPEAYTHFDGDIVFHFLTEDGSEIRTSSPISVNRYLSEAQVKRFVLAGGHVS